MSAGFGSAHLRVATLAERRREPALQDACRGEYAWAAVTAKEKLLQRAPHWSEEQAERALRAAESDGTVDGWGDLSKLHEVSTAETMGRLAKEERAAGHEPW
jgi:hypothetical protein